MIQGGLFVVSAPSGTGKTSLVAELVRRLSGLLVSISHTTRARRSEEEEGVNYFFVDKSAFGDMVAKGAMLEYADVFGEGYGTSKDWVLAKLEAGNDIILEIDTQGAAQVRAMYPQAVSIFILPPSLAALRSRLESRRQDDDSAIDTRLQQVQEEVSQFKHYDYLLVNDDFDLTLSQLVHVVENARLKTSRQEQKLTKVLARFSIKG